MWLKSYKWNLTPHTAYERRCELRVRESRHTCMLFDKKYFDIDTGKFVRDKLAKLNSYSLADMFDDSVHNHITYNDARHHYKIEEEEEAAIEKYSSNIYNFPYFTPKDNDFDEECKQDEEEKKLEEKIKLLKEQIELKEIAYQKQVKETEERLEKQKTFTNVMKNKWIPK